MRTDILDIAANTPAQHSREWFKARLGHFTGSQVGRLMKKGRGSAPSADTKTYIEEVAAERMINPVVLDIPEMLDEYIAMTAVSSRAIAWGIDNEQNAIKVYEQLTGNKVTKCGAIQHPAISCFYDSPDGLLVDADGVVEFKCPQGKAHMTYLALTSPEMLLTAKVEYYWQCLSHMAVTCAAFCDFVTYNPFFKPSMRILRIKRVGDVVDNIEQLVQAVQAADVAADALVSEWRSQPLICEDSIVSN